MAIPEVEIRSRKLVLGLLLSLSVLFGVERFTETLAHALYSFENLSVQDEKRILSISKTRFFNKHDALIWETALGAGIEPNLWKAIVMIESKGNANALSPKGAAGLAQLMPKTAQQLGVERHNLFHPRYNLEAGASYLSWLLVRFSGNTEHALAAYNAGPRTVREHRGIPSYIETQQFVSSVLDLYQWLSENPESWRRSSRVIKTAQPFYDGSGWSGLEFSSIN